MVEVGGVFAMGGLCTVVWISLHFLWSVWVGMVWVGGVFEMRGALYNGLNLTPLSMIGVGWYGLGGRGFCDARGFVQWSESDSTFYDQCGLVWFGWAGFLRCAGLCTMV